MKVYQLAMVFIMSFVQLIRADDLKPVWLYDHSAPESVRLVDTRRVCKAELDDVAVRLFTEREGELLMFWESKDSKCLQSAKSLFSFAPIFIPVDSGVYVNENSIRSVVVKRDRTGKQSLILRGFQAILGTVSDPEIQEGVRKRLRIKT